MRKPFYLTLITSLIILVNTNILGGYYHENASLRGVINLLVFMLAYRFISMERLGMPPQRENGRVTRYDH